MIDMIKTQNSPNVSPKETLSNVKFTAPIGALEGAVELLAFDIKSGEGKNS